MSEPYDLPGVLAGTGPAAEPPERAGQPGQPGQSEQPGQEGRPGPYGQAEQPGPYDASEPAARSEPEPEPEPLGVVLGETGNADVDAAVVRLRDADGLPVHAHIEVYEDVHRGLRDALSALDENRG